MQDGSSLIWPNSLSGIASTEFVKEMWALALDRRNKETWVSEKTRMLWFSENMHQWNKLLDCYIFEPGTSVWAANNHKEM